MINSLLLFTAGLTLFLFGMIKLSSHMQEVFSGRIRQYIRVSVKKPIYGLFLGTGTTILFQSSSATTLVTVSIVSAGLISFYHSLGIILGADIGTTLTAQLVVWKVTSLSPVIIFLGGILFIAGKAKIKVIGEAILYFGLIFFGLSLIGDATAPMKENKLFIRFFQEAQNPFVGIGIGLLFTAIVQASAIPIGILIILGQQGLVSLEGALPIVLGANMGTTVTAILGSLVTNINGKRSAFAHVLFKVLGVLVCLAFFPVLVRFLTGLSPNIAQQIAYGHLVLNILIVFLFIFLLRPFSRLVEAMVPGSDHVLPLWPEFLEQKCLAKPDEALMCVKNELGREIMLTQRMLMTSLSLIPDFKTAKQRDISYIELVVDNLQLEITQYLWNVSCRQLTPALSKKLFAFSSIVYDIERIGDRSTNIAELAESRHKRNAAFSDAAMAELGEIGNLVVTNLNETAQLIEQGNAATIESIVDRHIRVVLAVRVATERHLVRFYEKVCQAEAGPIFVDTLVNLERISDHCLVIAENIRNIEE